MQTKWLRMIPPSAELLIRNIFNRYHPAMNGQAQRLRIVHDLIGAMRFSYAIETGTYHGSTTLLLSQLIQGTVVTIENNPRYNKLATMRLKGRTNVIVNLSDSVSFLKTFLTQAIPKQLVGLFYLDAHWYDYLPLKEEIRLITTALDNYVILIDDFKVPGDTGYGFDDYGATTGELTLDYLYEVLPKDACIFFPNAPSCIETGKRRGCAAIVSSGFAYERCLDLDSLKEYRAHQINHTSTHQTRQMVQLNR